MFLLIKSTLLNSFLLLTLVACGQTSLVKGEQITGEGPIETIQLELDPIESIDLIGADKVIIQKGDKQEIKAVGHANIIERLNRNVLNKKWDISLKKGNYSNYELTIYITLPLIHTVELTGSGDVEVIDCQNQEQLTLNLSGSGSIHLYKIDQTKKLLISLIGSGNILARSQATIHEMEADLVGSGNIKTSLLQCDYATVHLTGSGTAEVYATTKLDTHLSGSGDILYKGDPEIKRNSIGSGKIRKMKL